MQNYNSKLKIILKLLVISYWLLVSSVVSAAFTYKLEVPIGSTTEVTSLPQYIGYLYTFAIGAVGIAALYSLVLGGVQYVTSAAVDTKADARDRILKALIGLGIALGSVIILNTINPQLVNITGPIVP